MFFHPITAGQAPDQKLTGKKQPDKPRGYFFLVLVYHFWCNQNDLSLTKLWFARSQVVN
jgi:hypothetical protein